MARLWVRAVVAFVAMDLLLAGAAAASVVLGLSSGREFGGAIGTALFVAVLSAGYAVGALSLIVPFALLLRRLGWTPSLPAALAAGFVFGVPTFLCILTGFWLFDGFGMSWTEHISYVVSQRRSLTLIPVFGFGGAIVLSGLGATRSRVKSEV